MTYNLGDIFETVARAIEPGAVAILCDGVELNWHEFDRRSNALARRLFDAGLGLQAKVGLYMRNGEDYLIAFVACLKARLVPFNVNYRYGTDEVAYLLDNADCEALIFEADFAAVVEAIPAAVDLKLRIVTRGHAAGAEPIAAAYAGDGSPLGNSRSPDDLVFTYTGGTTGLPKAVMWPSGALWLNSLPGVTLPGREPPVTLEKLAAQIHSGEGRMRFHIAPPLMHGTGLLSAIGILFRGGSVVLTGSPTFEPVMVLDDLERLHCDGLIIVGDAFARPILDNLNADPGKYNVSHIRAISSSGMMWSAEVKTGLLEHMPNCYMIDNLGASESSGFAQSIVTKGVEPCDAKFNLTGARVIKPDDLMPVEPGSGEIGILAKGGPQPLGYYKDPERTAQTYVTIDGERYVLGGDHAMVEADGTIKLLGRGSNCINSGGEKVYPEEVEEALKTHPVVNDALVFGIPDPRYGQCVAAIVSTSANVDPADLIQHVRVKLAGYKAPRNVVAVKRVPRAANGKADYPAAMTMFDDAMNNGLI
jgi:3-oxocholest-4-en-26-oate---CoA ligase